MPRLTPASVEVCHNVHCSKEFSYCDPILHVTIPLRLYIQTRTLQTVVPLPFPPTPSVEHWRR